MRVKECLLDSIYQLLQTYLIQQISIKMILEHSGISKSSFYRCYRDKYELMTDYYGYYHQKLVEDCQDDWERIVYETCKFIHFNKRYFQQMVKYQGQNSFYDYIDVYYKDLLTNRYKEKTGKKVLNASEKMMIEFECTGAVGLLKSWLEKEEMSYEEIAELAMQLMPDELKTAIS